MSDFVTTTTTVTKAIQTVKDGDVNARCALISVRPWAPTGGVMLTVGAGHENEAGSHFGKDDLLDLIYILKDIHEVLEEPK